MTIFTESAPGLRVVNALSDEEHPCQALADMQTLLRAVGLGGRPHPRLRRRRQQRRHLAGHAGLMLGAHVRVATPKGYALPADGGRRRQSASPSAAPSCSQFVDPREAVKGADAVYTDVWTSMGQEVEAAERTKIFSRYQVNEALMARAKPDAIFMHCLPAHRGQEVTDEVIESAGSVVFDQAENRLHAQKAMLVQLFKD